MASVPPCLRVTIPERDPRTARAIRSEKKQGRPAEAGRPLEDVPNPLKSYYFFLAPFFLAAFFFAGIRESPPPVLDLLRFQPAAEFPPGPIKLSTSSTRTVRSKGFLRYRSTLRRLASDFTSGVSYAVMRMTFDFTAASRSRL